MTEFGMVYGCGRIFLVDRQCPHPRGRCIASPKFFGGSHLCLNGLT